MTIIKFLAIILMLSVFLHKAKGQGANLDYIQTNKNHSFRSSQLVVPVVLIGYGLIAHSSKNLKTIDLRVKEELNENFYEEFIIDDFTQYSPSAAVYVLNACGIRGKHNFRDATVILATSTLLMASTVCWLKSAIDATRPDGSANNSFPSGHTATAFMGAEFLWQEYKDVSVWYGVAGYTVAAGTGFFRMYNNRHWLTDVVTGAGIGMLSTKIACWVNPFLTRQLFPNNKNKKATAISPYYNGKQVGVSCSFGL